MKVTALEEYGLRCAVQLAELRPGETLSAPEIAEREKLSVEYVSKFMLLLKKSGLVRTVRGMKGGFALAKTPGETSLKEIFDALSSKKPSAKNDSEHFCNSFSGKSDTCVRTAKCKIRPFWQVLSFYVEEFTREMTLADLLSNETHTLDRARNIATKFRKQHELELER